MKHYITKIALLSACLGLPVAKAAPFMAVGDNAELFLTAGRRPSQADDKHLPRCGPTRRATRFTASRPGVGPLVFGKRLHHPRAISIIVREIRRYRASQRQTRNVELSNPGAFQTQTTKTGVTKAKFQRRLRHRSRSRNDK